MDKKKPGWDCTVRYPDGGWLRAAEIKNMDPTRLVKLGGGFIFANFSKDIHRL